MWLRSANGRAAGLRSTNEGARGAGPATRGGALARPAAIVVEGTRAPRRCHDSTTRDQSPCLLRAQGPVHPWDL